MCENCKCDKYKELERKYMKLIERQKQYYIENKEHITKRNIEYYVENKNDIVKKVKEYQEKHKDEIRAKANEKVNCECGGRYTRRNKSTHMKSKKHNDYIIKATI